METLKQKDLQEEIRSALSRAGALEKREQRELRKAEATGKISSFLKNRANSDETLRASLALVEAGGTPALAQATIEYQKAVGQIPAKQATVIGSQVGKSSTETVLPPRPNDKIIYSLITQDTELRWEEGGGGGGSCVGLALYTKNVGSATQVWIGAGTVAGQLPSGFDPQEGKYIANGGSGNVWAEVNINETTGAIVSIDVDGGGSTPNNTDTSFYYPLGYYEYSGNPPSASVTNYGCGSLDVTVCRNWFAAEPPYWGLTFNR